MKKMILSLALAVAIALSASAQDVQAEFRLAVYRNASEAELTFVVPDSSDANRAYVEITDYVSGESRWKGEFDLQTGWNHCMIDISGYADGRYFANIKVGDDSFRRMLRIEHVAEMALPEGPVNLKKILFTPDGFLYKTMSSTLAVKPSKAEMIEVGRTPSADGLAFMPDAGWFGNEDVDGDGNMITKSFYQAADGTFVVRCIDFKWQNGILYPGGEGRRKYIMSAVQPEGPYTHIDSLPALGSYGDEIGWFDYKCGGIGEYEPKDKYELYDPAKHGTYTLHDVSYFQQIDPRDFGCVKAGYRTYWLVAKTSTGDEVMLRDTPLFVDVPLYKGDEFDNGFTTNDNFGNFWLSEDDSTLYCLRGQTVRRFPPYDVPYDMVPNSLRIMTIYSSRNGVDWEYCHSITAPTLNQTPGEQQYGGYVYYLEDADIYIAYIDAFDGDAQRSYLEINYSRDGINFYKLSDSEFFAKSDTYGAWDFGQLYREGAPQRFGDRIYTPLSVNPMDHTQFEGYYRRPSLSDVTAADFHRAFDGRQYERLTHFEEAGGWEGIAENTRNGFFAVGLAACRIDGWFGLVAGKRAGKVTTREMTGGGLLCANAVVEDGGRLVISLLDENGRVVSKAKVTGDSTRTELFNLPEEGTYSLRLNMKKATIYSLTKE